MRAPRVDYDATYRAAARAKRAVQRAHDDTAELHRILAAGYTAAVLVFRRPKLWPVANALRALLERGDPNDGPVN